MEARNEGGDGLSAGPDRDWAQLPPDGAPGFTDTLQCLIDRDLQMAASANVWGKREGHHRSRTPLVLDAEGWRATGQCIEAALQTIEQIQRAAATRLDRSPESGINSTLLLLHFEIPGG